MMMALSSGFPIPHSYRTQDQVKEIRRYRFFKLQCSLYGDEWIATPKYVETHHLRQRETLSLEVRYHDLIVHSDELVKETVGSANAWS